MPVARKQSVYDPAKHDDYLKPYYKRIAPKRVLKYNPAKHDDYLKPYHRLQAHMANPLRRKVYPKEVPSPFAHTAADAKYFTRYGGVVRPTRKSEQVYRAKAWPFFAKARMPGKRLLSFVRDRDISPGYTVPKRPSAMDVRKYYDVYDKAPSSPRLGNFMSGGMYYRVKKDFMKAIKDASDAVAWAEKLQKKLASIQRSSSSPTSKPRKPRAAGKKARIQKPSPAQVVPSPAQVVQAALQATNQKSVKGVVKPRASPTPTAIKRKAIITLREAAKSNPAVRTVVKVVKDHSKKNGAATMGMGMRTRSGRGGGGI